MNSELFKITCELPLTLEGKAEDFATDKYLKLLNINKDEIISFVVFLTDRMDIRDLSINIDEPEQPTCMYILENIEHFKNNILGMYALSNKENKIINKVIPSKLNKLNANIFWFRILSPIDEVKNMRPESIYTYRFIDYMYKFKIEMKALKDCLHHDDTSRYSHLQKIDIEK